MKNTNSDSIGRDAIDCLYAEWARIDAFHGVDPGQLAQDVIDVVVKTVRRDPQWRSIQRLTLDLLFADARREIDQTLSEKLNGYLPAHEMLQCTKNIIDEVLIEISRRQKP